MPRTIAMGAPEYFSVRGGANPHTRNILGLKKRVDPVLAQRQWHNLARTLITHGVEVCVIPPHRGLSGLVYPANAGFLYPLTRESMGEASATAARKIFYLSNLLPTRAAEREVYRPFIRSMGYETRDTISRFEGEADFFPAGRFMIFTYGRIERQRFVPRFGMPPWRRVYGFRSEAGAAAELGRIAERQPILALELCLEAHYHGDTVLCSFGPKREFLLAYLEGLTPSSRERVRAEFGANLLELSDRDAAVYAPNAFQADYNNRLYLFLPEGVSDGLLAKIRERSVEPVLVNVSEFLAKGGGSIKCMILDLGPRSEQPSQPGAAAFRAERSYQRVYQT
jgi:N-dimethylarginine dimethylaminohydrolase